LPSRSRRTASDSPFEELHRQEGNAAVLADLVDGDDVIVLDRGRRPRLAQEALPGTLAGGHGRQHRLEGHEPRQSRVLGAEDDAHAPDPEHLQDAVGTEPALLPGRSRRREEMTQLPLPGVRRPIIYRLFGPARPALVAGGWQVLPGPGRDFTRAQLAEAVHQAGDRFPGWCVAGRQRLAQQIGQGVLLRQGVHLFRAGIAAFQVVQQGFPLGLGQLAGCQPPIGGLVGTGLICVSGHGQPP
jgi:hypothetical protein